MLFWLLLFLNACDIFILIINGGAMNLFCLSYYLKMKNRAFFFRNNFLGSRLLFSSLMLGLALFHLLFPTSVFANSTINVNISSESLVLDLTPKTTEGNFAKSDSINIGVSVTGPGGYTLGIRSGNSSSLVNSNDESKSFSSIPSAISESDFSNPVNITYNNMWGYLPSKYNSVANTSFQPAPDVNGDILEYTENENATGNYTVSIGARANLNTAIGSYSNTFIISAVANMSCNSSAANIREALCMQDLNEKSNPNVSSIINSMEFDKQYQLKDNRDWKTYYIAKMKDGRVWMTQNLDLDLTTYEDDDYVELNSDNTDLNSVTAWEPSMSTVKQTGGFAEHCDEYDECSWDESWDETNTDSPFSLDIGSIYRYPNQFNFSTYDSLNDCEEEHSDGSCSHYRVGNFYNFSAAVASNDTSSVGSLEQMPDSICPAGWRLPVVHTASASTSVTTKGLIIPPSTFTYSDLAYTMRMEGIFDDFSSQFNKTYIQDDSLSGSPFYFSSLGIDPNSSTMERKIDLFWYGETSNENTGYAFRVTQYYGMPPFRYSETWIDIDAPLMRTFAIGDGNGAGAFLRCLVRQTENTGTTTVHFNKNSNEATGTMNDFTLNANTTDFLPVNTYSRLGYTFVGWNTEPDGNGVSFKKEDDFDPSYVFYGVIGAAHTEVTLYAQWTKTSIITFSLGANVTGISFNGTYYTDGQTVDVEDGKSYVIGGNYDTKYGFNSWSVTAGTLENSNAPATNYTVSGDATITLTSKEATTDITTLTAPSSPVSSNCKNEAVVPELVYDPRDNEAYYVARLCDGRYWMLDNLRLDLADQTVIDSLNSSNTNATDTQLNYLKSGGGTTSDQYPTEGLSGTNTSDDQFSSYLIPLINNSFKHDIAKIIFGLGSGKKGVYYNYCTVSAGTFCWDNGPYYGDNSTIDPDEDPYRDIEADICPRGWKLPSGLYDESDYGALFSAYDGASLGADVAMRNALSAPLSELIITDRGYRESNAGYFWTSTWNETSLNPYYSPSGSSFGALMLDSSRIYLDGDYLSGFEPGLDMGSGVPVRCVMDS